jgi:hypothetical protein
VSTREVERTVERTLYYQWLIPRPNYLDIEHLVSVLVASDPMGDLRGIQPPTRPWQGGPHAPQEPIQ